MATDREPVASTVWDEWESFRDLGHLTNHWDRPGWTEHTRTYHWFLTFEHATDLHRLTERCHDELDDVATLDPVPPALLHLTLERVAYAGDITPAELDAVTDTARRQCSKLAPFAVRVGPLAGSAGAVRFSVTPHEPVAQLRRSLIDAMTETRGDDDDDPPPTETTYVPHISIAYSNTKTPAAPIVERVERLRRLGSVLVPVGHVDLVRLRREGHLYLWDPVASVDLTG